MLFDNFNPGHLVIYFIVFLFSLSFHEAAHAWTSERFGDNTGRYLGRITLNPMAHIDPIGTILFPLIGYFGVAMFGWAKPVPVNPLSWRNKKMANIMTSAAGPLSNLLLALIAFIIIKVLIASGIMVPENVIEATFRRQSPTLPSSSPLIAFFVMLVSIALILNVALAVFNILPIPPLDGSHVLEELLPYEAAKAFEQVQQYGFVILLGLMWSGALGYIFGPVFQFVFWLI